MHDVIGYGTILLATLCGIFFNNSRFSGLEARMDRMQADLSQFYLVMGKHDARLDSMEKRN